ncbi:MAG: hypothetical protein VB997_04730, partial [Opitutales bacterium]
GDHDEPDLQPLLAQCAPPVRSVPSLAASEADRLANELKVSGRRWLVVAGPHAPGDADAHCSAVATIAERLQAPVLADALSGLRDYAPSNPRLVTTYDAILRSETDLDELAPDAVLSLGPLPTSKTLRKWLGKLDLPTWVVDPSGRDVDGLRRRASHLTLTAEGFASTLTNMEGQGADWEAAWAEREAQASASLDEKLSEAPFAFEGRVAWSLSRCLPTGVPLFAASSMPVRDLDYFWRPNAAGRRIFFNRKVALCSKCHQIEERGTRVGPDLTFIGRNISRKRLLENILQPSKELAPHYRPWSIAMEDGVQHTGIALRRGGNAEVYLGTDGKEIRLDKRKIKEKQVSQVSLMPAGLAHTLTLPELRDLMAFLMESK